MDPHPPLDAAGLRELDVLRRRAYGPDADIQADPTALARLLELEELVHRRERAAPGAAEVARGAGARHPSSRPRWHTALVVAVGVAAIALGIAAQTQAAAPPVAAAPTPTVASRPHPPSEPAPPEARKAFAYAYASGATVVAQADVPAQLAPTESSQTGSPPYRPVGTYFGVTVWAADSPDDDRVCLLLEAARSTQHCVSHGVFASGGLMTTVSFAELSPADRPGGMTPQQSLAFWWTPASGLTMVTGLGEIGRPDDAEADADADE